MLISKLPETSLYNKLTAILAQLIGRLNQTQFYGNLCLIFLFETMAMSTFLNSQFLHIWPPNMLPVSLILLPFIFIRKKMVPDEFAHLPTNRLTLIVIGFIVVSLLATLAFNYLKR